ncbi:MAG TPA: hypothetical protein ENG61_01130 [Candidatus Korarchaeota archaeon]|nr:hypothetical protein [Candidatus Korarchaeota archaeon]
MFDRVKRKVSYIGIDIDSPKVFDLLLIYMRARKLFPHSKIEVFISPSGRGFHLKIWKRCTILENIFYRAAVGDDPERLRLSIAKLFLNPDEQFFDILFDVKFKKKSRKIDLEKLLNGVNLSEKSIEEIREMAEKLEGKIKMKECWVTCIAFSGEEFRERLKVICEDIAIRDPSFKYKIYQSYFPKHDYVLVIFSDNKNQAYQRGEWFRRVIKKELGKDINYWVKIKKTK